MPDPTRFAGYDSPGQLAEDRALTREQKVSALLAWRAVLQRSGAQERTRHAELAAEIERALAAIRVAHE